MYDIRTRNFVIPLVCPFIDSYGLISLFGVGNKPQHASLPVLLSIIFYFFIFLSTFWICSCSLFKKAVLGFMCKLKIIVSPESAVKGSACVTVESLANYRWSNLNPKKHHPQIHSCNSAAKPFVQPLHGVRWNLSPTTNEQGWMTWFAHLNMKTIAEFQSDVLTFQ